MCVHNGQPIGYIVTTDNHPCTIARIVILKCYRRSVISLKLIIKLVESYDSISACMAINDTLYMSDLKDCGFETTNTISSYYTMSRII